MDVSDKRSPEELIASYLEGLNPSLRQSETVKTDPLVETNLAFEFPAFLMAGHATARLK
jgi:hypothetical protein